MAEADKFWETVKNNLKLKNPDNKLMATWFDPTKLVEIDQSETGCRFRLGVPTDLHKYWISENFFDRICQEISGVYKSPFSVELVVTGEHKPVQPSNRRALRHEMIQSEPTSPRKTAPSATVPGTSFTKTPQSGNFGERSRSILNPDYTFSTFVVGRNTEFVHAASYYIAENPAADGYTPLFILGPTGMGKTHLMNAIGNHVKASRPAIRIGYLSAEKFINEFISSIRRKEMDKFRHRYREQCDMLLIDDIQILGRTEAVQEEFFHTLNHFLKISAKLLWRATKCLKKSMG